MSEENKFGGIEEDLIDLPEEDKPETEEKSKEELNYFEAPPQDAEVIGVRFRSSSKIYYFDPQGEKYPEGCHAVVETTRGQEYGIVAQSNHIVSGSEIVLPLRAALRIATKEDDAHDAENRKKAEEAFLIGNKKIEEHKLDMKLIDTEYTFDNSKLLFYFTSDGRVDFRDLVKDLASIFRCRIELRQMGIRDEAKILGGLGICGRPFCCHAFLPDFVQVSIKMAKEQNLALNSAKISGACGRLMCCLRYEYDAYLEEGRLTPKVDSLVNTPEGIGVVVEAKPLVGLVKVRSLNDQASAPRVYHRDQLTPIKKGDDNYEKALEEKSLEKQARAAGTTRAALKATMNETPEKTAEKAAKAERLAVRASAPEPKKAASYTGQVTPIALMAGKDSKIEIDPLDEEDSAIKEQRTEYRKNDHRRGRRDRNRRPFPEKPAKQSSEQAKEERTERPARYEKTSGQQGEKQTKQNRQNFQNVKNRQKDQPHTKQQNPPKPSPETEGSAKNAEHKSSGRRPFRHYKKSNKQE